MKANNRIEQVFSGSGTKKPFLVKSPAYITYLTGISFPYPDQSPFSVALLGDGSDGKPTLVIPVEWVGVTNSWTGNLLTYSVNDGGPIEAFLKTVSGTLESYPALKQGLSIDSGSWTVKEINYLKKAFPRLKLSDCSEAIDLAKMIKSDEEIENLRKAAIISDRGLIGAFNHVEGTITASYYTISEFLERIRVHAIEFGANCIGDLNVSQGKDGNAWYTPITDFSMVEEGNMMRINYSLSVNGYWCDSNRTVFVGKPDREDLAAYEANQKLVKFAETLLKPGTKISAFCKKIQQKAEIDEIQLLTDFGMGHGVGTSECEMPVLSADNQDTFKEGMVISMGLKTLGMKNEIILSSDIYLLTSNGYEKLSDFMNWDDLYLINGVRSNH